ncbi:MAG: four helix bundle protein, partial [Bacteroidota bacterium]
SKDFFFRITSQIRRASVSVAANIAESYGRRSPKDKARFFNISEGSLDETKYFLILAKDLGFIKDNVDQINKADEVAKLLYSYKRAILNSNP